MLSPYAKMATCVGLLLVLTLYGRPSVADEEAGKDDPKDQEDTDENLDDLFLNMDLDHLLDLKVYVSTQTPMTVHETPGIVTVITADEIRSSGARDLVDVLRLVPGIDFGVDVEGTVGIAVRGNWAHEGKVLLLIDGQEMNETLYSTIAFGHHYPVRFIDRIEIIRGPGSALYGGSAALAVINVISKNAEQVNGVGASVSGGLSGSTIDDFYHRDITFSIGGQKGDFHIVGHGFVGWGNRSHDDYVDVYGDSYNMVGNSALRPMFFNFNAGYKGLEFRLIVDNYRTTIRDIWDQVVYDELEQADGTVIETEAVQMDFRGIYADLRYEMPSDRKVRLTPYITYKVQQAYLSTGANTLAVDGWADEDDYQPYTGVYFCNPAHRIRPGARLAANLHQRFTLVGGIEGTIDHAYSCNDDMPFHSMFIDDREAWNEAIEADEYWDYMEDPANYKRSATYLNLAAHAQAVWANPVVNITAGGRFEAHSEYGLSVVPRLGLTKQIKRFHFKVLGAGAFRAPSFYNIDAAMEYVDEDTLPTFVTIKPEKAWIGELELGLQLSKNWSVTTNGYLIHMRDPIVYFYHDLMDDEGYYNETSTGTAGAEAELMYKGRAGQLRLNYSYYASLANEVWDYEIPGRPREHLGLSPHKVAALGSLRIYKGLSINPSLTYYSPRHSFSVYDEDEDDVLLYRHDAAFMLNAYLLWSGFITPGLDLGVGVYNIADAKLPFVQPYNQWHAPIPGSPREVFVRLEYNVAFK